LLSQGKRAMESTTMTNTTTRGVLLLAESEKWYGWRFELQEISYSR
jgi:hypothetical protein